MSTAHILQSTFKRRKVVALILILLLLLQLLQLQLLMVIDGGGGSSKALPLQWTTVCDRSGAVQKDKNN